MPVHVVGVCLLIEFGEALEVDPGFCSCFSRGTSEGVSAATGEKGGEPGLGFVLVPEVLPLQGMHGPMAMFLWPPCKIPCSCGRYCGFFFFCCDPPDPRVQGCTARGCVRGKKIYLCSGSHGHPPKRWREGPRSLGG